MKKDLSSQQWFVFRATYGQEGKACEIIGREGVRVIKGAFEGVEGRVARVTGQQRVVITLEGLCIVATAYIPSAFLTKC